MAERTHEAVLRHVEGLLLAGDLAPGDRLPAERALPAGEFHALDSAFHVAIADAAGNAVTAAVMAALREAIQGYVHRRVPTLPDWAATAASLRAEHAAVLDAVSAGDGATAARLVEAPIRGFFP